MDKYFTLFGKFMVIFIQKFISFGKVGIIALSIELLSRFPSLTLGGLLGL